MRVYLAVPLKNNRNKRLSKQLFELINSLGHQILSDWILLDDPNPNLDPKGIYQRDYNAIKNCDVLLAEVSKPSTGIGMEIMLAKILSKKIICVHQKEEKISNFLIGMSEVTLLSYSSMDDLFQKLTNNQTLRIK